jgi:hypothetical protein
MQKYNFLDHIMQDLRIIEVFIIGTECSIKQGAQESYYFTSSLLLSKA